MALKVLTEEHLTMIEEALKICKTLKEEVTRANQAGIELSVTLEDVDNKERRLLAIKNAYFAGVGRERKKT